MAEVEQQNVIEQTEEEKVEKTTEETEKVESTEKVEETNGKEEAATNGDATEEKEEEKETEEKTDGAPVAVVSPQKRVAEAEEPEDESPLKKPKVAENEEPAVTEEAAA